jgi:hypothetical protein
MKTLTAEFERRFTSKLFTGLSCLSDETRLVKECEVHATIGRDLGRNQNAQSQVSTAA